MNVSHILYPACKYSGPLWLGDVPGHWEVRRLRTVTEMRVSNVDKRIRESEFPVRLCNYVDVYKNDRITLVLPFMNATASREEIERFRLNRGDVLITKDSEAWDDIGVPALVMESSDDLLSGYHLALLRPFKEILGAYLAWVLQGKSVAYQFHVRARGVTRYGLTHVGIRSVRIPLPPLSEQRAIVRYLDHVDRRIRRYISAKQKLVDLLEEEKQALINQAVTRGLDPSVRLKPSGVEWLGDVPEHWELVVLKFLSKRIQNGSTPPTIEPRYYQDGTIPWYGPSSCTSRGEVGAPVRYVTRDAFSAGVARMIHGPALLIVVIGATAGRMALLQKNGSTNQQITSFELKRNLVHPVFVLEQAGRAEHWLRATASTATIPILDSGVVSRLSVAIPPLSEQSRIVEHLNCATPAIDTAITRTRRQIELLQEYRARLIADVVTGKLDVRGATAHLRDELDGQDPVEEGRLSGWQGEEAEHLEAFSSTEA